MSVYVIRSDVYKKNIYKIGYTTKDINYLRGRYGTSLGTIEICYFENFADKEEAIVAERQIHEALDLYRLEQNHEIFRCPFHIIDYELSHIDGRYSEFNGAKRCFLNLRYKLYLCCHC